MFPECLMAWATSPLVRVHGSEVCGGIRSEAGRASLSHCSMSSVDNSTLPKTFCQCSVRALAIRAGSVVASPVGS